MRPPSIDEKKYLQVVSAIGAFRATFDRFCVPTAPEELQLLEDLLPVLKSDAANRAVNFDSCVEMLHIFRKRIHALLDQIDNAIDAISDGVLIKEVPNARGAGRPLVNKKTES
jgi:hypothetical protein